MVVDEGNEWSRFSREELGLNADIWKRLQRVALPPVRLSNPVPSQQRLVLFFFGSHAERLRMALIAAEGEVSKHGTSEFGRCKTEFEHKLNDWELREAGHVDDQVKDCAEAEEGQTFCNKRLYGNLTSGRVWYCGAAREALGTLPQDIAGLEHFRKDAVHKFTASKNTSEAHTEATS